MSASPTEMATSSKVTAPAILSVMQRSSRKVGSGTIIMPTLSATSRAKPMSA